MKDNIQNFNKQFEYQPVVQNQEKLGNFGKFIVVGMGGSNLAGGLLKTWQPEIDIVIHRDYGLPDITRDELKQRLLVFSSYSGNTEEVIDAFNSALKQNLAIAVISTDGKLLELARQNNLPYIQMPDADIPPRLAVGFNFTAMLKIIGQEELLKKAGDLNRLLNPAQQEGIGKNLAEKLKNKIPVIYSSTRNFGISYYWKVSFNETAKTPAFYNVFPELNHTEIAGSESALSKDFYFVFLKDRNDKPRVIKRMTILEKLYCDRGLPVQIIDLADGDILCKIFNSVIMVNWAAYYLAQCYSVAPDKTPIIEEFKELMK